MLLAGLRRIHCIEIRVERDSKGLSGLNQRFARTRAIRLIFDAQRAIGSAMFVMNRGIVFDAFEIRENVL
jgi:hypothetical protein